MSNTTVQQDDYYQSEKWFNYRQNYPTHKDYVWESENAYMGSADYYLREGQLDMFKKVQGVLYEIFWELQPKDSLPKPLSEESRLVDLSEVFSRIGELKKQLPNKVA